MLSDKLQKVCGGKGENPDLDPSDVEDGAVREEGCLESRSATVPNGFENSRESLLTATSLRGLARIRGKPTVSKVFLGLSTGVLQRWEERPGIPLRPFCLPLTNGDSVCTE
jgi:hypothetical protein